MIPTGYHNPRPPPDNHSGHETLASGLEFLSRRVDRLSLACQALWELVRDNTALSDADVVAKVEEVDLRDGHRDGRCATTPRLCPSCERPLNRRQERCLYCGHQLDAGAPFLV